MKSSQYTKLIIGLLLLFIGSVAVVKNYGEMQNTATASTFATEPVKIDLGVEYDSEILPERIVIPDVSVDLKVEQAELINGYWEVYDDSAGWGIGSGLPGEKGNQVIFAHAIDSLFGPLNNINVGSTIYILANKNEANDVNSISDGQWFSYSVEKIKEVYPNQTEVIAQTEDETLTLYTCSGYKDGKRFVVTAKRQFN